MIDPYPRVQPGDLITAELINRILADLASRTSDTGLRLGPLAQGTHTLVALGTGVQPEGGVWLNGEPLLEQPSRGLSMVILDSALGLKFRGAYDTHGSADESRRLANDLETRAVRSDVVVVISHESYLTNLESAARASLAAVGGAAMAAPPSGRHNAAFVGVVPTQRTSIAFDYLVSVMPADTGGSPAGLAFVWAQYSTPLRRFLLGGGAGSLGGGAPIVQPRLEISGLAIEPPTVVRGATATGRVTLRGRVPPGAEVTLTSSNSRVAVVPSAVPVPEGQDSSAPFTVTTNEPGPATISAAMPGVPARSVTIVVNPAPAPPASLASLSVSPKAVERGVAATGVVVLSGDVRAGTEVTLTTSNARVAVIPATVAVPVGQGTSATFQIATPTAGRFDNDVTVSITASLSGSTPRDDSLTVRPNARDRQETKDAKDTKDNKDNKENKDTKDSKDNKENADNKNDKDNKEEKENKDRKETKEIRDGGGPGKIIVRERFDEPGIIIGPPGRVQPGRVQPLVAEPTERIGSFGAIEPAPNGRAFIRAEERPVVGQSALADAGDSR